MLYITLKGSKKRLYVNLKGLGGILLAVGYIIAYMYLSNQDYLSIIGK